MQVKNAPLNVDLHTLQHRLRVIQALRFTVLCASAVVMAALTGMTTGITTLVPAVVLILFLRDERFITSLALLAGVLTGALFVFLNTSFWAQVPFLYLLASMIVLFGLGYWTAQGIRGRWPFISFALGASLTILTAVFSEISGVQNGVDAAFVWVEETPLGILLFWIILIGLWPSPTARDIVNLVDATQRECATLLHRTVTQLATGRSTSFVPSPLSLKYFGDIAKEIDLHERALSASGISKDHLLAKLKILSDIYVDIRYIQRSFEDIPAPELEDKTRAAATDIMSGLAKRIEGQAGSDLEESFEEIDRAGESYSSVTTEHVRARRLAARLAGFSVAAKVLERKLATLEAPIPAGMSVEPTRSGRSPFIMKDSLQAAVKLIVGVLLGIGVTIVTDLPASAYLVVAILIILAQPNIGRAHLRIRLWFPGVLAGSLWALAGLLVLSYLPHFGIYLVWFLPGLFVAGYLGAGPDRVSYMGLQVAASMATILGMAVFPTETVMSAEARVLGACVGFLIALSVYYLLWPTHPAELLRISLSTNLRDIANLLSRLSANETAIKDADLDRQIADLQSNIEADFTLIYDFSYMMTHRVSPAYDYSALLRETCLVFAQLWCLDQSLSTIDDEERKKDVLAPIRTAEPNLVAILKDLADRLERSESTRGEDIQDTMDLTRKQVRALHDKKTRTPVPHGHADLEYGVDIVSLLSIYLFNLADAMKADHEPRILKTAELAHLYEGAKQ